MIPLLVNERSDLMEQVRHMSPLWPSTNDEGNESLFKCFSSDRHLRAWDRFRRFARPFGIVRLFGAVMIIPSVIMVHEYVKKLIEVIKSNIADKRERTINYVLHLISETSTLLYRTAAFVQELKVLKLLSATAVSWAPFAMGVSAPLQFATLGVNLLEWRNTKKILADTECKEYFEKDKEWYKDNFWVWDGKALKKSCETLTDKKKKALHERLWSKKLCHVLYAVSVVVSLVATAAFLFSPFAPVGYVLFTAAVLLEIGIWGYNAYVHHKFTHKMGIEKEEKDNIVVRMFLSLIRPFSNAAEVN